MIRLRLLREKLLSDPDLTESLKAAQVYGSLLNLIDIGQYDDPQLEVELAERAYQRLPVLMEPEVKKDCLHIISEALIVGGHTRLMEKLGSMHETKPDLLVTRNADIRAKERLSTLFTTIYEITPADLLDAVAKIRTLCSQYQRLVLHIHSDDIVTVVACALVKRTQAVTVAFVNHADHAFTFGSSIADYYFQLSSFGARLDKLKNIVGQTSFLGIPITNIKQKEEPTLSTVLGKELHFFSSGSAVKFRPFRGATMRPLIDKILKKWPESTFTFVGINIVSSSWLWPLKLRYGKRITVSRLLPYDQFIALSKKADFYMDSFPFPGGTAFAEQILAGKRGIGRSSKVQGYSPADKLKKQNDEQVLESIENYRDEGVYEEILSVNGYDAVKTRYLDCLYANKPSNFSMESLVPWTGDAEYLKVRDHIFTPVDTKVIQYVYYYHKKLFWEIFYNLSWFNKVYFMRNMTRNAIRKLKP